MFGEPNTLLELPMNHFEKYLSNYLVNNSDVLTKCFGQRWNFLMLKVILLSAAFTLWQLSYFIHIHQIIWLKLNHEALRPCKAYLVCSWTWKRVQSSSMQTWEQIFPREKLSQTNFGISANFHFVHLEESSSMGLVSILALIVTLHSATSITIVGKASLSDVSSFGRSWVNPSQKEVKLKHWQKINLSKMLCHFPLNVWIF